MLWTIKQLFKRLSYSYRHHDYWKWIGPEDGIDLDGERLGEHHFVYTIPWYNGLVDWFMIDVFKMDYTYNRFMNSWHKVHNLTSIL